MIHDLIGQPIVTLSRREINEIVFRFVDNAILHITQKQAVEIIQHLISNPENFDWRLLLIDDYQAWKNDFEGKKRTYRWRKGWC
jgi:hypothetical protein